MASIKPCKEATPFMADDFSRMATQFYHLSEVFVVALLKAPSVL